MVLYTLALALTFATTFATKFSNFVPHFSATAWAAQTVAPFGQPESRSQSRGTLNPTQEERDNIATAHEQTAACLRSELDFADCHDALQEECHSMVGKQSEMKRKK